MICDNSVCLVKDVVRVPNVSFLKSYIQLLYFIIAFRVIVCFFKFITIFILPHLHYLLRMIYYLTIYIHIIVLSILKVEKIVPYKTCSYYETYPV